MRLQDYKHKKMAPPKRINPFPLSKLLQFKFLQDFDITGKPQANSLKTAANNVLPLGNINMTPRPLDRQYQDLKERAFEANQFATLDNEVGSLSSSLTEGDAMKRMLEARGGPGDPANPDMTGMFRGVSDAEINRRIGESRSNLGKGTLTGLLSTLLQSSRTDVPKQDDRFLDRMVRKTPQYLVDAQNAEVDRTTNSAIGNVLANNPINRASNAVNAIVAQGVEGKNRVAIAQGQQDIGLENTYLGAKQQSLNQYNANTAQAQNMTRDSENTRIGNLGALGTNYFNQVQDSINNMNMLKDRNEILKSNNYMQMQQWRALMKRMNPNLFKD